MANQQQQQQQQPPIDDGLLDDEEQTSFLQIDNNIYTKTMESFLRIALAGFGGAIVGISLAKRGGLVAASSKVVTRRGRYHHTTSGELPAQWAMACIAFASIFEGTRALSPTTMASRMIVAATTGDMEEEEEDDAAVTLGKIDYSFNFTNYACTIGDYAIGGAMAGVILRGLPVAGKRTGLVAPRLGAGLFAGLVLGVFPGVMVATIAELENYLEITTAEEQEAEEAAAASQEGEEESSSSP